ncbi:ATP-binding protein [Candidatus Marithioploca araucensis]|uniref:ATP-binding protein n=1 Tax=Candidatus Marithioploca araucensis TaxID=70273 RepID=A0ABT7VUX5_9GAMM|nr:ATP-binding protein [Candidatus Marithioploca araucensis]
MTSQNKMAWLDRGIAITSIIVGTISILQAFDISFPPVRLDILLTSTILLLIALVIKRLKRGKSQKPEIIEPTPPISNFTAQLGTPPNPGFLPKAQRLTQIKPGQNPYVCGSSLRGNSAVFYGRGRELGGILGVLGNPDKPGNVSILGERRIGKSSLLNQLYQALAAIPHFVTIHTTMQNWSIDSQATFFSQLHQVICNALKKQPNAVDDFAHFRDFILDYANKGYRFVLMIDEFDKMTDNPNFDATFFSNMRALGERHEYQFAYMLSSYAPLSDICHEGGIQESKFWNIFGREYTLGLLAKKEAAQLIQEPMQRSLNNDFKQTQDIFAYSGYHPAFIQIVASEYWTAHHLGFDVNADAIQQTLRHYYQDLWQHRTETERDLLLKIAQHETPRNNATLDKLRQRGLVDADNQLFARFFGQVFEKPSTTD